MSAATGFWNGFWGSRVASLAQLGLRQVLSLEMVATKPRRTTRLLLFAMAIGFSLSAILPHAKFGRGGGDGVRTLLQSASLLLHCLLLAQMSQQPGRRRKARPQAPELPELVKLRPDQSDRERRYSAVLQRLNAHMGQRQLYRTESLTLRQIATEINLPSRQISGAVNSLLAISISQYVNILRIRDACSLLDKTDRPICEIVFAVGFTTKSNFNREFSRLTGTNPTTWRRDRRALHSNQLFGLRA